MMSAALLLAFAGAGEFSDAPWPARLEVEVSTIARRFPGQVGLFVEDVRSGERYGLNGDAPMYLASGVKIPVMIALFRALETGLVRLDETMVLRARDLRDGSPLLSYLPIGAPVALGILLEAMVQSSDNTATDLIIRRIGLDAVNAALPLEGLEGFGPITSLLEVRRLVYRNLHPRAERLTSAEIFELAMLRPLDRRLRRLEALVRAPPGRFTPFEYHRAYSQYYEEGWNSAPMRAMGRVLVALAAGRVVSKEASARMLEVMKGTRTGRRRFLAGLPEDVVLAHKTGTQHRRTCDFGVMYLPGGRPVAIAASVAGGTREEAERVLAALARATLEVFVGPSSPPPTAKVRR